MQKRHNSSVLVMELRLFALTRRYDARGISYLGAGSGLSPVWHQAIIGFSDKCLLNTDE